MRITGFSEVDIHFTAEKGTTQGTYVGKVSEETVSKHIHVAGKSFSPAGNLEKISGFKKSAHRAAAGLPLQTKLYNEVSSTKD